ncbi:MAG: glyoxylate/hydroxypyruvate reductase A [Bacteroidota bacterium]
MSIAIYTGSEKLSLRWQETLHKVLPEKKIEVYPNISDFKAIQFLICWGPYSGLIDKFYNLKAIQSLGAGVDHIFKLNVIDPKIKVIKIVHHQLRQDMWEHALGVVLADMKNFHLYYEYEAQKYWKRRRYRSIKDTSIGILGLGRIGGFVAQQFTQLGFEVKGWSRSKKEIENVSTFVGQDGLDQVCEESDYLINILPLTQSTIGILDERFFRKMKSSGYLVNLGRGPQLIDNDLLKCLDSDQIRGAYLDVFQVEPLPDHHAFWYHPKVIVTPHIASITDIDSVYPQVVENIRRLELGQELLNTIDVERGY